MIYGSVCSGIEAATVGWHSLGWQPAWFSEIEPFPCRLLNHYYPHVPNLGNMLHLKNNLIYNESIINLLVGGTPCQDFSVAGLRAGLAGERGNLTLEFCRILIDKKPRWFVWENVPGAFSSFSNAADGDDLAGTGRENGRDIEQTADFAEILTAFSDCGYSLAWRVLDAQFFGVPQRRRRVFVVGYLGNDWRPPAAVLFDGESLSGNTKKGRKKGQIITGTAINSAKGGSVAALTKSGVGTCGADDNQAQAGHLLPFYFEPRIARNGRGGIDHVAAPLKAQSGKTGKGDGQGHIVYDTTQITSKQNGSNPQPGDPCHPLTKHGHPPLIIPCWWDGGQTSQTLDRVLSKGQTMPEKNRFPAVLFRINNSDGTLAYGPVSPVLKKSNNSTPALLQGLKVRRITPLECERLQGFPDYYTNIPGASDTARYQALGNSMAVPVMQWIGKRIDIVDKYFNNV